MMKTNVAILLISISLFSVNAQKLKEYRATNDVNYKIGDTVKLGLGSGLQGTFVHLKFGGIMAGESTPIGSVYSNTGVVIKRIRKRKIKGKPLVIFTVGGGNITNYVLYIDSAIQTCEVIPCNDKSNAIIIQKEDKYDKLAKLKKLYDDGVLTEKQYETEKEKILKEKNK